MPRLHDWWHKRTLDRYKHPDLRESSHWINKRVVAFFLAYGAVLLGVWAEFDTGLGPALGAAVSNVAKFLGLMRGDVVAKLHTRAAIFCVCLLGIATLLWKRLRADDRRQDERTNAILRALHQVPNLSVMSTYAEDYWPRFLNAFQQKLPSEDLDEDQRRAAIARVIRDGLAIIAAMAQHFAHSDGARYGANVMLVIARNDAAPKPFPLTLVQRLRFHSGKSLDELSGLLYLPDDLVIANLPGSENRTIARIVLPIPLQERDLRGRLLVIPGAPAAVLRGGGPSVHEDTRKIATECADFAATIRDEIEQYFSPAGDGRDVLSFASLRLGNDRVPIGVLNIDSDATHVLGLEDEFYVSFYGFLRPMVHILAQAVTEYAALLDPETAV